MFAVPSLRDTKLIVMVLAQVGDFGVIDKKTGEFDYHGNIYTDEDILQEVPALAEPECKPIVGEPILKWVISANVKKEAQATVSPNAYASRSLPVSREPHSSPQESHGHR